jgi:hypothetical protein
MVSYAVFRATAGAPISAVVFCGGRSDARAGDPFVTWRLPLKP